jgi:hypothetical protein
VFLDRRLLQYESFSQVAHISHPLDQTHNGKKILNFSQNFSFIIKPTYVHVVFVRIKLFIYSNNKHSLTHHSIHLFCTLHHYTPRLCQYTTCFGSAEPKHAVYWHNLDNKHSRTHHSIYLFCTLHHSTPRLCQYTTCFGSTEPKHVVYWYNLDNKHSRTHHSIYLFCTLDHSTPRLFHHQVHA